MTGWVWQDPLILLLVSDDLHAGSFMYLNSLLRLFSIARNDPAEVIG